MSCSFFGVKLLRLSLHTVKVVLTLVIEWCLKPKKDIVAFSINNKTLKESYVKKIPQLTEKLYMNKSK